jgi:hypothetical protein
LWFLCAKESDWQKLILKTNQFEIIFDKDLGEIKNLRPINNNLYFVSSYSGKNSLYRLNFDEKSVYLVYESRFGIESPAFSPSGKKLIVSDYTADGFRLIKLETDQLKEQNH